MGIFGSPEVSCQASETRKGRSEATPLASAAALRGGRGGPRLGFRVRRGVRSRRERSRARRGLARGSPGRAADDVPHGPRWRPRTMGHGRSRWLERGHPRLPEPALVRGPAHRAGQPGAPAQPALRALPRPGAAPSGTRDTHALVVVDVPVGHRRRGREARVEPALRVSRPASSRARSSPGAETSRRVGPRRVVVLASATTGSVRGSALLRQPGPGRRRGRPPGCGSRRSPTGRRPRRRCSTSSPAPESPSRLTRMCGRYASSRRPEDLIEEFEVVDNRVAPPLEADYNVAPTKEVYAVVERPPRRRRRRSGAPRRAERQLRVLRWGLVPSWAKDPSIGNRMINARMETVAEKPAYRGRSPSAAACCRPTATSSGTPRRSRPRPASRSSSRSSSAQGPRRPGDGRALRDLARPDPRRGRPRTGSAGPAPCSRPRPRTRSATSTTGCR